MARIDALVSRLIEHGGSDLHLSAGRRPMMRLRGEMLPLGDDPSEASDLRDLLLEITPESNRQELEACSDTDFAYEIDGFVRLRSSLFVDRLGMGGVFRVIPANVVPAEKLGLPTSVTDLCYLPKGLVVVTGPTGSGKSTTLAAMIDLINRTRKLHIITIEDPIEFVHKDQKCLITQREVHTHTESFAGALRASLRQDPDVVLVGEMRDLETVEVAIETAETGHLVFGTLHTNTAAGTVDRIVDCFPSQRQNQVRMMLASSLKGAVSQALCRRVDKGMTAAMEILVVDRAISAMIRDDKPHQIPSAMQIGRSMGMRLLNESLTDLVRHGVVDAAEAYSKSVDREDLLTRFQKFGIPSPKQINSDGAGPVGGLNNDM